MKSETPMLKYTCPKCSSRKYKLSEIRVAYNFLTQILDIQAAKYTAIICERCKYTEFYNIPARNITNVFDFFVG
jgi:predicted nucleic-acid-binding Zn-ribbon protein